MIKRSIFSIPVVGILLLLVVLSNPAAASADQPIPPQDQGSCIHCHEDLYFLHDTGNWYCIKEAPMTCVDCHGGNPSTMIKELAHLDRAAHPVINEDISKCQQCHPQECTERLQIFDETAGISDVLVAMPYTPKSGADEASIMPIEQQEDRNPWMNISDLLPILLLIGIALIAYTFYKTHVTIRK